MNTNTLDTLDFGDDLNFDVIETKLGVTQQEKKNYVDERFWKLSMNENKVGNAIIQLLPTMEIDENGKFEVSTNASILTYENWNAYDDVTKKKRPFTCTSPSTIGLPCPVNDLRNAIYAQDTTESQDEAKLWWPKTTYITNIKVIKDPANPQNEGKIFLWKHKKEIADIINEATNPDQSLIDMGELPKKMYNPLRGDTAEDQGVNGINYSYYIRLNLSGSPIPSYKNTKIERAKSSYKSSDEVKHELQNNCYSLKEFLLPENIESYEEIQKRLTWMLAKYKSKTMSESTFNAVVDELFGVNKVAKVETPAVQAEQINPSPIEDVSTPFEEPTPKAQVEEKPADDMDLGFLDDI